VWPVCARCTIILRNASRSLGFRGSKYPPSDPVFSARNRNFSSNSSTRSPNSSVPRTIPKKASPQSRNSSLRVGEIEISADAARSSSRMASHSSHRTVLLIISGNYRLKQFPATFPSERLLRIRHSERRGGSFIFSSARTSRLAVEESLFALRRPRNHDSRADCIPPLTHWASRPRGTVVPKLPQRDNSSCSLDTSPAAPLHPRLGRRQTGIMQLH
jgi:hypothetical protein